MPLASYAVKRSLGLKPQLPDAFLSRACIRAVFDWDWQGSERDFETAIHLNPTSAQARHWFAMNCLAPCRRFERADRELRLAMELESESPAIATSQGVLGFL